MNKLSARHTPSIKKISKRDSIDEDAIIKKMKEDVKRDPAVIEKCKEYGVSIDDLDDVHVEFADLDVSAKTKDQKIYLNRKMLEPDSEVKDPTHYLAHESIHWAQQVSGHTNGHKVDDYLHKPTEQAAFQVQIDFKERHEGKGEADKYLSELLNHHNKDGKERQDIKEKLKDDE